MSLSTEDFGMLAFLILRVECFLTPNGVAQPTSLCVSLLVNNAAKPDMLRSYYHLWIAFQFISNISHHVFYHCIQSCIHADVAYRPSRRKKSVLNEKRERQCISDNQERKIG